MKFKFSDLNDVVISNIKQNIVPCLLGEAGIGKSAFIKNIGNTLNTKVNVISINMLGSKEDLTGARTIKDDKTNTYRQVFFPHADVQDVIDYALEHPDETPILFLDEINRTTTDITDSCMQLITERKIGTTPLPENVRLVAAGNDSGNISHLDTAKISRFAIYKVQPEASTFLNHLNPEASNKYIEHILDQFPELILCKRLSQATTTSDSDDDDDDSATIDLYEYDDIEEFDQFTTPRTLEYLGLTLNDLGFTKSFDKKELAAYSTYLDESSDEDLLKSIIDAHIGDTRFARELYAYMHECYMQNRQTQINNPAVNSMTTLDQTIIDTIKSFTKVDDVQVYFESLPVEKKQQLYLYAISDSAYGTFSTAIINVIVDLFNADLATSDFVKSLAALIINKTINPDLIERLRNLFNQTQSNNLISLIELYTD